MVKFLKFLLLLLVIRPIIWAVKFLLKLTLVAVICLLTLLISVNLWLPKLLELEITRKSGFPAKISKSYSSIFRGRLELQNVVLKNPTQGFKSADFLKLNHIIADVDWLSLFKKSIIIEELAVDINSINVVKNDFGVNNCLCFIENIKNNLSLKSNVSDTNTNKKIPNATKKKSLFLRKFMLSLGSIRTINESNGDSKEYTINYRKEFIDVDNYQTLEKQLTYDLGKYGINMIIDSAIASMINLPNTAINGIIKAKDVSLDVVNKVGTTVAKTGLKLTQQTLKSVRKIFGNDNEESKTTTDTVTK